jgi:hypothetical protein
MSRRVVSSLTPPSVFLELLFVMRSGVTAFDLESSAGSIEVVVDVVVPERRRVLRRGGRFSESSIVSHATTTRGENGRRQRRGEVSDRRIFVLLLVDLLNECRRSVCDVSCLTGCLDGGGGGAVGTGKSKQIILVPGQSACSIPSNHVSGRNRVSAPDGH